MKKSDTTRRTSAKSATSRLLQAVAGDQDNAARLAKLGFASVFDIAKLPREHFVTQYYSAGGATAEGEASSPVAQAEPADMHTLAVSYANQLLHLSRQVARVQSLPAMAPAVEGEVEPPGALADGVPTYQGQFKEKWDSMCKPDAIEAKTSPVHYLVDLYKLALALEEKVVDAGKAIKLDTRRNDLKDLFIDEQSTYQEIPTLSLVLEILDKAIQNGDGSVVVDDVMATTRYPFQLPFDLWMKQISMVLQEQETDLGRVIQQADTVAPYFPLGSDSGTQTRALLASSQLNQEAYTLIDEIEPSDETQKSKYLWTNFGLFELKVTDPSETMVNSLSSVSRFLKATSLTGSELDALFSQGNYKPKRSSAIKKPEAGDLQLLYGSAYINSGSNKPISSSKDEDTITGLSVQNLWKINKLIRLQRWTEVPFDRIDWVIRAATQATPDGFAQNLVLDDRTVRAVGLFKRWRERYRIKPESFCTLIWQLNPYAAGNETPFYDQLFGAVAGVRNALLVDGTDFDYTDSKSASVQTLCAGLQIKAEELALIASIVAKAFSISGNKLQQTLPIFSALYRLVALPRLFGYSVREGQALLCILASVNPKWMDAIIKATPYSKGEVDVFSALLTAEALVDWLQSHTMTPLAVEHALGLAEEFPVETEELVRFAQELGQQVQAVCLSAERFAQSGLPTEELPDQHDKVNRIDWMKALATLVDEQGLIKEVSTDTEGAGGKEGWHALPDYKPEFAIKHLHFVDDLHGWAQAHAEDGSIDMLRSSDGGITWTKIALEIEKEEGVPVTDNNILDGARVFARASDECWCIGTKVGTLLQIKGKHIYERKCQDAADKQLHDVCFVNDIGWAVGEQGIVIKSTDGGKNWTKQAFPNTQANLFRVVFKDQKNGWIGAKNNDTGTVYYTNDGGTNWTQQIPLPDAAAIDQLNFVDTQNGWARAQVGDLTNWHLVKTGASIDPKLTIECLHFFDRHHGWATAQQEDGAIQILQTDDSGVTWSQVQTPPVFYRSRVFAKGANECWCIGNDLGQLIQIKDKKGTVVGVPGNWRLYDICFTEKTGWAVGAKGVLLKSTDGGATWVPQISPNVSATFLRVSFINDENGWIGCGDAKGGAVYRTTNGGITWTTRSQGHASYIDHFGFVDAQTGWARTLGSQQDQWQLLSPPNSAENVLNAAEVAIKQLHFVDEKHGWAISSQNGATVNVIKTADGGQTWLPIQTPTLWANTRVFARGVEECWCIADANNTLIQINGTTSKTVSVPQGERLQDVCFAGAAFGLAVGDQGVVMSSPDGGQSWNKVNFPDTKANLLRVTFQDGETGWISGENQGVGTVYRTLNGGQKWTSRIIPLEHAAQIDLLHFVDTQNGWARAQVGELGQWRALPNDYDQDFTIKSLHFVDKCHGWAKAQKEDGTSQLLQSTDSGISWSVITDTPLFSRSRIFAKGRNECWGIGQEIGQLIQIKDGQQTVCNVPGGRLYDLCFIGNTGWAVGAKGTLLKSEDGGQSWKPQSFPTKSATLLRVYFFDANNGWVTGGDAASGVIYSTSDGGVSWTVKAIKGTACLDHLSFVDAQTGWVSAKDNEPSQWRDLSSSQAEDVTIKYPHFVDETHGWAISSKDDGTVGVLKTSDGGQTWSSIKTPTLWANTRVFARGVEECWCVADANDTLIQINGTTSKEVAVPEGGRLHDVYFGGPAFVLGIAVGEQGVIMRSPNGGMNWFKQPLADQSATLHRVTFDDDASGWIGGDNQGAAVVYHSTDYGLTWTPCAPLEHAVKIDQLHFTDGQTGWAKIVRDKPDNTGSLDGILSTQNGGLSWQEQQLPGLNYRPLRDFNFIDQTHGWLISDKEIFYTADGGKNWEPISNPLTDANLQSIFMFDPWHGWIGATAGGLLALRDEGKLTLRRTTNAGADWQVPASAGLQGTIHDVVFTDQTNGWLVGEKGMIFNTTDGGNTWSRLAHPISGVSVWSLFMLDATHGWIGGSAWSVLKMDDAGAHVLVRTRNGGVTWQERAIPELCEGPIRDIGFVDPYNGWLVSEKGIILRTFDGGSNWNRIANSPVDVDIDLWSISMVDAWHGWIGASDGYLLAINDTQTHTLMRTWDGGTTWQAQAIPELGTHPINDVAFIDADKGWVVSEEGTILYTQDGGVTWAPLIYDTQKVVATDLRAIYVLDPSHAWIGGAGGTVLTTTYDTLHRLVRTTNAGSSWQLLDLKAELGEKGSINDFQFVDQKNGWLVSSNGIILHTDDGGDSWSTISPIPLPTRQPPLSQYASLLSISFVDAKHGWIGGEDGHLLKNIAQGSGIDGLIWAILASLNLSEEDRKRSLEILTALFKSTQAAQNKCAYMAISKVFGPEPRQVPWLFSWMDMPVHDLLAGCLETMARQAAGIAPSKQRTPFVDLMYTISRYAVALNLLKLSDAALQRIIPYPERVAEKLPPVIGRITPFPGQSNPRLPLSLAVLYFLSRLHDLISSTSQPEEMVLRYIETANGYDAYDTAIEDCTKLLAVLTNWEIASIQTLFKELKSKLAKTLAEIDWILRCKALSDDYGLPAEITLLTRGKTADYPVRNDYKVSAAALIARYNDKQN